MALYIWPISIHQKAPSREVMRERTDWGGLLDPKAVENIPPPDVAGETLRRHGLRIGEGLARRLSEKPSMF